MEKKYLVFLAGAFRYMAFGMLVSGIIAVLSDRPTEDVFMAGVLSGVLSIAIQLKKADLYPGN